MYSYGSAARVGGSGKRGHGGRPYRAPPNRSKQEQYSPAPPPLKHCDCLVEMHVPEYLTATTAGEPRNHYTFGGRQAMQAVVKQVRTKFQCHLQIPGKSHQGKPVALVAATVQDALPACHYVMQHVQRTTLHNDGDNDESSLFAITARIHRNVKANVPVLTGRLYKVTDDNNNNNNNNNNSNTWGCLFRQDDNDDSSSNESSWSVAYYGMSNPAVQLPSWQTCVDNITFADASCQYQIVVSPSLLSSVAFAMGSTTSIQILLMELQKHAQLLAADTDTNDDKEPDREV